MIDLNALDFDEVEEIHVTGGSDGPRVVYCTRKEIRQRYWEGSSKQYGPASLYLEGSESVNFSSGVLSVVLTGEILQPFAVRMRDGSVVTDSEEK
ncbi:hypothetical protein [Tritonibacter mobilis]|uniref:hypothetical protein n=1 Tax=Tritonibacter mobilis TaxID=379347 RepID=UPI001C09D35D|nr:hypothetical protein [Tritonibacter mobilis]MBU3033631.1 hypothetical protein [Tritonibacter mobilis]WHQ84392.1 hypothetical protein OMR53_19770 [Tritonibacter mobilis]